MNFNFQVIAENFPTLLQGAVTTIELVALGVLVGFIIAVPTAMARTSSNVLLRLPAYAYIFFFRGTPLLVQIFLVYYGLSQFEAVRESVFWTFLKEPYWCAIIAFSLNTGAYTAEIFRGAIQAVPAGEVEAARAFGMSKATAMRRIIWPRALRICLPAYGNEIILMVKGSALASTITLLDLTGMARTVIAKTYMPVEIFLAAGVIYLAISFVLTRAVKYAEKRFNGHLEGQRG